MNYSFSLKLIIRGFIFVFAVIISIYFFKHNFFFTTILSALFSLFIFTEAILFLNKTFSNANNAVLAMLHDDYSVKFPKKYANLVLHQNLEKLHNKLKLKHFDNESIKIIYENIINGLDFGLVILRKKEDTTHWDIYLMNDSCSKTLHTPKYKRWLHLKEHVPVFAKFIEKNNFSELNKPIELSFDDEENKTYSLKTSLIKTYKYTYYIIALDSVQSIIEKKEKQAWYNLLKVISHEMMNTLTPISALLENLEYLSEQDNWTPDDRNDVKMSLKTIKKKTLHIMEFANNYRELANLPKPIKIEISVEQLLQNCITLMTPVLNDKNVEIFLQIPENDLRITVDEKLIERVFINLITNSLHALRNSKHKKIKISVHKNNNRTYITFTDYGHGIEKSIWDKLFIPFFTTRENGGGIGLPLSKSIIEAHGGYLTFKSNEKETSFIISLIEQ